MLRMCLVRMCWKRRTPGGSDGGRGRRRVLVLRGVRLEVYRCTWMRGRRHTRLQIMTEHCKPASHLDLVTFLGAFLVEDTDFDAFVVREVDYFVPGLVAGAICPVHVVVKMSVDWSKSMSK